jgi:hypothetical protein
MLLLLLECFYFFHSILVATVQVVGDNLQSLSQRLHEHTSLQQLLQGINRAESSSKERFVSGGNTFQHMSKDTWLSNALANPPSGSSRSSGAARGQALVRGWLDEYACLGHLGTLCAIAILPSLC